MKNTKDSNYKYRQKKEHNYDITHKNPVKKSLISEKLYQLLSEETASENIENDIPEKQSEKLEKNSSVSKNLLDKAEACGINIPETLTRHELIDKFKIVLRYVFELEKLYKITGKISGKDQIFKVDTIEEMAQIFDVPIEGKDKFMLYIEIMKEICES